MEGGANTTGTKNNHPKGGGGGGGRRVMVLADPTRESASALQYALSHAMVDKDELILLHVMPRKGTFSSLGSIFRRPHDLATATTTLDAASSEGGGTVFVFGDGGGRDVDFLDVMKRACEAANPQLKVRVEKVEQGHMDKATTILFRSKLLAIDLLIIGQRRNLSAVLLGPRRNGAALLGGSSAIDTAEFLIENSLCTCVGVQKKGQNAGYLLNTKTHKNFWLLA